MSGKTHVSPAPQRLRTKHRICCKEPGHRGPWSTPSRLVPGPPSCEGAAPHSSNRAASSAGFHAWNMDVIVDQPSRLHPGSLRGAIGPLARPRLSRHPTQIPLALTFSSFLRRSPIMKFWTLTLPFLFVLGLAAGKKQCIGPGGKCTPKSASCVRSTRQPRKFNATNVSRISAAVTALVSVPIL